ncbi:uncharacterized protein LOC112136627 [Oryzias melastigma]|uniref:uncharacterized protein LOC112136627 n=1 Tax=Oryzias melastigma TaxID=30732 RepID=UPI00168CB7C1|nr:uncharacterized protein LOC112136627 [Oryzias melastigma]
MADSAAEQWQKRGVSRAGPEGWIGLVSETYGSQTEAELTLAHPLSLPLRNHPPAGTNVNRVSPVRISVFSALEAAAIPTLTCNATKLDDNSIKLQISPIPRSPKCQTSWEDEERTVIVDIKSNYNKSIVKTAQNDSVELHVCKDFLLYKVKCWGIYGRDLTAVCEVNCTRLMAEDSPPEDNGFPTGGTVGITLAIIVILALIFILVLIIILRIKTFPNQDCCGFTFHNNRRSQTKGLQSSLSQTQSEADAIMDNLKNEQVSTDASPFLPERADPEDPEDVKPTPLSACNREPRSA